MKTKIIFLIMASFIVMTLPFRAYCGPNSSITGKVIESVTREPLSFATVALQNFDNRVVRGATTGDDGLFKIENLETGKYTLKISFIGFRDTLVNVEISDEPKRVDLGNLTLCEETMGIKSAIVTAKVPLLEQKLDKIVMNISESSIALGSNATEIIRRAPGVTIDSDGNLLLNGKPVQIWIDGRPSNLNGSALESFLESTDGSTIDKIEVIAHPSAKYDASGSGGIINLKTKKNFAKGLSGSARATLHTGFYDKPYPAADGSIMAGYRGEKSNTTITYSPRINKSFHSFASTTQFSDNRKIESYTQLDRIAKGHNLRISSDIFIDKKNIAGFIINGSLSGMRDTTSNNTGNLLYNGGILTQKTKTYIGNNFNYNNFSLNLNYTHIFKEGTEITSNIDYYNYYMPDGSSQKNIYLDQNENEISTPYEFRSSSEQLIKIYSAKTDFETGLWEKAKLESGLKYAVSLTDNSLIREEREDGLWVVNPYISSSFNYREDIAAAYATLSISPSDKFNLKAGIRGEMTQATGEWISSDTVTKKSYLDLFPSLFFGYNPSKTIRLSISYSKRVQRPNYEQLNPQRFYIDSESSMTGNPDILPQYTHNINISAGLGKFVTLTLRGDFTKKIIVQNPGIDPITGEKIFIWENFGNISTAGAAVSLTELPLTKWLSLTCNVFGGNMSSTDKDYSANRFIVNGNFRTTFALPWDCKFEVSGFYQSKMMFGYLIANPRADITLGLRKNLLNNNATISLLATDIFKTHTSTVSTANNPDFKYDVDVNYRSQRFAITFVYRFGQSKAIKTRKVGGSDEAGRVSTRN